VKKIDNWLNLIGFFFKYLLVTLVSGRVDPLHGQVSKVGGGTKGI